MRSCLIFLGAAALSLAADVRDCSCGFEDFRSGQVYTDATIVYFNETIGPLEDFFSEDFAHKREHGWNTVFRAGAIPDNVAIANSTHPSSNWNAQSLNMFIDPSTPNHLVKGASIQSMRQDMHYGSIRAFMRGSDPYSRGSAMSMIMQHNRSSGFDIDVLNMDESSLARVTTLKNGEFPSAKLSVNYTADPWGFIEVQVDWSKRYLNYTVAHNKSRVVRSKSSIPSEPLPLIFRHYSTGDSNFMQGPPVQRAEANVAWVRAFFNSSLTTESNQEEFDERCRTETKCNVDDTELRGATPYSPQALVPWKQPPPDHGWGLVAAIICGSATALGVLTLVNVFFRRKPWKTMFNGEKRYEPAVLDLGQHLTSTYIQKPLKMSETIEDPPVLHSDDPKAPVIALSKEDESMDQIGDLDAGVRRRSIFRGSRHNSVPHPPDQSSHSSFPAKSPKTSFDVRETGLFQSNFSFGGEKAVPEVTTYDFASSSANIPRQRQMSLFAQSRMFSTAQDPEDDDTPIRDVRERQGSVFQSVVHSVTRLASIAPPIAEDPEDVPSNEHLGEEYNIDIKEWNTQAPQDIPTVDPPYNAFFGNRRPTIAEAVPIASINLPLRPAKSKEKRINYLAGLVAFACLGVTATHFCLTFVPYAGGLDQGMHYKSENVARWFATPYIMDPIWLGPLFVTSCRFLAGGFFKNGDLKEIAQRMLLRAPRMLIPAIVVAMLEYFLLEEGLLSSLEWLPSISWSSWPYIVDYNNFAQFMNDTIELAYLIPNAAPRIVEHYCVGVLWTVPVQLQFSYTALLAVVIVRDIKTPYKRFLVYAIAILTNWYAISWGACFWSGVMLADMQITFKVSKRLQAKPMVWYPLAVFLWMLAIAAPTMSMLEDRLKIPTMTGEHYIHPDPLTGHPIGQSPRAGYPRYFEPRLNTLVFATCIQFLLETSTWFQAFFSLGFWQPIFPYAYTVYLIHGFIWWTLGSYMVVQLGMAGLPYWANLLVTAVCCYLCLALATIALSPVTDMANAAACRNIERWATAAPVPTRATLSPFPHDLFFGRRPEDDKADGDEEAGTRQDSQVDVKVQDQENEGGKVRRPTHTTIQEVDSLSSSTSNSARSYSSGNDGNR
ncbi:hypothetical protein AAFC00_000252 [Neodothiora populina]|uniref:GH16 domain-containing protein n=1 Tax=Neodothiora populina TaxID=2781224 RepID=A0ABR3P1X3_9PEZI